MRSIRKWPNPPSLFPVPALLALLALPALVMGGTRIGSDATALMELVNSVRIASFPELKDADISVRDLKSDHVFLETRFTITSYIFRRHLRYMLFYNSEAARRHVPPDGLRAI